MRFQFLKISKCSLLSRDIALIMVQICCKESILLLLLISELFISERPHHDIYCVLIVLMLLSYENIYYKKNRQKNIHTKQHNHYVQIINE